MSLYGPRSPFDKLVPDEAKLDAWRLTSRVFPWNWRWVGRLARRLAR